MVGAFGCGVAGWAVVAGGGAENCGLLYTPDPAAPVLELDWLGAELEDERDPVKATPDQEVLGCGKSPQYPSEAADM